VRPSRCKSWTDPQLDANPFDAEPSVPAPFAVADLTVHTTGMLRALRRALPPPVLPTAPSAGTRPASTSPSVSSRVSQFLALVADPWVAGHAGDPG
jgi:hypothetical protein